MSNTFLIRSFLPLIIVDNRPNMHNTGFFPDCYYLLSVTNGSIWIPYLTRYSEIFKKTRGKKNFTAANFVSFDFNVFFFLSLLGFEDPT